MLATQNSYGLLEHARIIHVCAVSYIVLVWIASRVREVLNGKREISLTLLRRLRDQFHISPDLLISREQAKRARTRTAA